MNILISVDSNYLDKAKTMLYSVRMHTEECIIVYLLNHSLKLNEVSDFVYFMSKRCNISVVEIDVSKTELDNLPIGNLNFSIEMYYRILAQFLLPESLDRVLWLDADLVVLKSINDFYNTNFSGKKYIVAQDMSDGLPWVNIVKRKINLPQNTKYFNSGVLLINLELLRRTTQIDNIIDKCISMRNVLTYPDQDILNYLYCGQVGYVDPLKYNYQLSGKKRLDKKTLKNIVILHYTGKLKPWFYWNICNATKPYWKVRFRQGGCRLEVIKSYCLYYYDKILKMIHKDK